MKRVFYVLANLSWICAASWAQDTLRVSDEIAPPGGVAQIKIMQTIPDPISGGRFAFDAGMDFIGLAIFDPAGTAAGVATEGSRMSVSFTSTGSTLGTLPDYPIVTIAVRVPADAPKGKVYPIALDGLQTALADLSRNTVPLELKAGSITVGGTLNVSDVQPGSGFQTAGTVIRVFGSGFNADTRIRLKDGPLTTPTLMSSTEIDLTLNQDAKMDGAWVEVRNKTERVNYFSYMRGQLDPTSSDPWKYPLLTAIEPIFPTAQVTTATVPASLYGLALQNPNLNPATVTFGWAPCSPKSRCKGFLTLQPGSKLVRSLLDLPGFVANSNGTITSDIPIQVLGLATGAQTVTPLILQ